MLNFLYSLVHSLPAKLVIQVMMGFLYTLVQNTSSKLDDVGYNAIVIILQNNDELPKDYPLLAPVVNPIIGDIPVIPAPLVQKK